MRLLLVFLISMGALLADGIPREEYQKRRADLRQSLDGVLVLFGAAEPVWGYEARVEEAFMIKQFGAEYEQYRRDAWPWL